MSEKTILSNEEMTKAECTARLLKIARKYRIRRIGIGCWDNNFKKSKDYVEIFGKAPLNGIETSIFADEEWAKLPAIWQVANDAEYLFNIHRGCGNEGQHQLETRIFEKGIYRFDLSKKEWEKVRGN